MFCLEAKYKLLAFFPLHLVDLKMKNFALSRFPFFRLCFLIRVQNNKITIRTYRTWTTTGTVIVREHVHKHAHEHVHKHDHGYYYVRVYVHSRLHDMYRPVSLRDYIHHHWHEHLHLHLYIVHLQLYMNMYRYMNMNMYTVQYISMNINHKCKN